MNCCIKNFRNGSERGQAQENKNNTTTVLFLFFRVAGADYYFLLCLHLIAVITHIIV